MSGDEVTVSTLADWNRCRLEAGKRICIIRDNGVEISSYA